MRICRNDNSHILNAAGAVYALDDNFLTRPPRFRHSRIQGNLDTDGEKLERLL